MRNVNLNFQLINRTELALSFCFAFSLSLSLNPSSTDCVKCYAPIYLGGFMESLDKEWILHGNVQNCEQFEKTPNTLGLKNMAGVFILVGAGIVGGICLIIIEVVYKKHQIKKQKRIEIARHAADKWRGTIEVMRDANCNEHQKTTSQRERNELMLKLHPKAQVCLYTWQW